jgi:hypothetical protein
MTRSIRARDVLLGVLLAASAGLCAAAADEAAITGTIVDPLGARVAHATVTLLSDGQVAKETHSDEAGAFAFNGLAEGRYQIRANADGFQVRLTGPIFVAGGAAVSIDVSLPLGPLETDVTVTAAATEILPSTRARSAPSANWTSSKRCGWCPAVRSSRRAAAAACRRSSSAAATRTSTRS